MTVSNPVTAGSAGWGQRHANATSRPARALRNWSPTSAAGTPGCLDSAPGLAGAGAVGARSAGGCGSDGLPADLAGAARFRVRCFVTRLSVRRRPRRGFVTRAQHSIVEDVLVELTQARARVDAILTPQRPGHTLERIQRAGAPTRPVQGRGIKNSQARSSAAAGRRVPVSAAPGRGAARARAAPRPAPAAPHAALPAAQRSAAA